MDGDTPQRATKNRNVPPGKGPGELLRTDRRRAAAAERTQEGAGAFRGERTSEALRFTNTVTFLCATPGGHGAQREDPQSGLWSERRESPRSGASGTRAEPAASGRKIASVADAEAPRDHLAPWAACGYVAGMMEWITKTCGFVASRATSPRSPFRGSGCRSVWPTLQLS
jgi:hypothetical protein